MADDGQPGLPPFQLAIVLAGSTSHVDGHGSPAVAPPHDAAAERQTAPRGARSRQAPESAVPCASGPAVDALAQLAGHANSRRHAVVGSRGAPQPRP
jgi:hypothetical protein